MIHGSAEAFAQAETPEALFKAACELAVDVGGYNICWVGLAENDQERSIRVVASAGRDKDYVEQLRLSWADTPEGRGPSGTSIREGRQSSCSDIRIDPLFEPWRDRAVAAGFRASISIPFRLAAETLTGTFTLYSCNPTAFGEDERTLLAELTGNITKSLQEIATRQERDAALVARSMSEQRIERLLTASSTVLYSLTLHQMQPVLAEISRSIFDMLGYAPEDIYGLGWWRSHVHPDDLPQARLGIQGVCDAGHYTHRYRIMHRNGSYRWIRDEMTLQRAADGNPSAIAGVWIDITAHRTAEEEIYRLAHLDPLTGLPNRRLLNERLSAILSEARRYGSHGAILFIDLDRFKNINDMLGHTAGDAALMEAARRLRMAIRATDTIARIGGDEFVILLAEAGFTLEDAAAHATRVGRKMIDAITGQPIVIGERDYHLGASIGFTLFPKPADTIDTLIREADTAMYQAKAGNGDVVMFLPAMHQSIMVRHTIENEIRAALRNERFEIWLQDQVDNSGMVVGAECLMRLRKGDGRIASPSEFIGIAESSGLIIPLGRWLLREACSILSRISPEQPGCGLSVNISPRQFRDSSFVTDVLSAMDDFGVAPDRLTLEITENLLIKDTLEIGRIMGTLAGRGVRFSVDDFGTGYSSLHYLRHLPIREIKIDRSFVTHLPHDVSSVAIVEAILAMAHRLDLDVVAEGVETAEHVAFLRTRGLTHMQGYFFAKPLAATIWLERLLVEQHSTISRP
nr:EAL domain-containing protein [Acidiphilium multivorum]